MPESKYIVPVLVPMDWERWRDHGYQCPRCGKEMFSVQVLDHNQSLYHCGDCHTWMRWFGFDGPDEEHDAEEFDVVLPEVGVVPNGFKCAECTTAQ